MLRQRYVPAGTGMDPLPWKITAFNVGLIIGPPAYQHLNWCPALLMGIYFLINTGTDPVQ